MRGTDLLEAPPLESPAVSGRADSFIRGQFLEAFERYARKPHELPLLLLGDALEVLGLASAIKIVLTSGVGAQKNVVLVAISGGG